MLIGPLIAMDLFWTKGYFYNIGNVEIPKDLDFGFYDIREPEGFIDKHNNHIDRIPRIWEEYWFVTRDGLGQEVNRELIINGLDEYK